MKTETASGVNSTLYISRIFCIYSSELKENKFGSVGASDDCWVSIPIAFMTEIVLLRFEDCFDLLSFVSSLLSLTVDIMSDKVK